MSDKILHKRSLVTGSIPTTSNLSVGELAINVPDGKIFLHKSSSSGESIETVVVSNSTTDIGTLTLSGSLVLSGSLIVTDSITGSLFGTASYANNADLLDGSDSTTFATTGSNVFRGLQTIDGNVFLSGSSNLVYNNNPSASLLFGQFDGSTIHGPYYQQFGNQYSNLSQRGGAEIVYDIRNNTDANFHVASFNGSTWIQKFLVNDSGVQVTGSLDVTGSANILSNTLTVNADSVNNNWVGINTNVSESYIKNFPLVVKGNPAYDAYATIALVNNEPLIKWRGSYNSGNGAELYQNGSGTFLLNSNSSISGFGILSDGSAKFAFYGSSKAVFGWNIGDTPQGSGRVHIRGQNATNISNALYVENSAATQLLTVRDDGYINLGTDFIVNGSLISNGFIDWSSNVIRGAASNLNLNYASSRDMSMWIGTSEVLGFYATNYGPAIYGRSSTLGNALTIENLAGTRIFTATNTGLVGINKTTANANLDVSGSVIITGSLVVTQGITGSLLGTASYADYATSASYALTASYLNTLNQNLIFNGNLTLNGTASITYLDVIYETASVIYSSGSNQFGDAADDVQTLYGSVRIPTGSLTVTGSVLISGSTTQIGNNTLLGNTTLSGSIVISGSLGAQPTVQVYGNVTHDGYIRFNPVSTNINQSISASYIYVSGSTNDLYFTQNGAGYNNTTRLRWLEGNLYTGLLNGGLITISTGSTWFNLSSGSGIIVDLNASLNDNPYPTVNYINWGNFISQSITYLTSSIQSYIGIDENGQITQQTTPYVNGEYNTKILIGTVLHQNQTTVNASITYPNVAYGYKQRTYDFIKAFGPLKLSGYTIVPSSSLGLTVAGGTAWADGRNYQTDPNNPSYIVDPGTNVSKIFRYYQSGSVFIQDTNGGLGYTVIDPTKYNNNGTLTSISPSTPFTIQRVFWYPNSATKGIVVYYGNAQYASISEAAANLNYETFNEVENTKQNAIYLGAIVIKYNGVFTNANDYIILPGGIFRSVGGSGGGGSVVTTRLVDLSDVNISGPTDGQALVYNTTALKWENKSTINASILGNAATATTASYALTSSVAFTALTASYVSNAISSSFASTASYINPLYQNVSITGNSSTFGNNLLLLNSNSDELFRVTNTASVYIGGFGYTNAGRGSLRINGSDQYVNASTFEISYDGYLLTFFEMGTTGISPFVWIGSGNVGKGIKFVVPYNKDNFLVLGNNATSNDIYSFTDNLNLYPALKLNGTGLDLRDGTDTVFTRLRVGAFDASSNVTVTGSLSVTNGITGSLFGSSSYALTASYALTSGGGTGFPFTGSAEITGSLRVIGAGITGSLLGTASYAIQALSASYAPFTPAFPYTGSAEITGSLVVTGSISSHIGGTDYFRVADTPFFSIPGVRVARTLYLDNSDSYVYSAGTLTFDGGSGVVNIPSSWTRIANLSTRANGIMTIIDPVSGAVNGTITTQPTSGSYGVFSWLGRIGVGVNTPTAKIHIQGEGATSASFALRIENSATTPLLTVRDDGNIGIGTTPSTYKLDIVGGISLVKLTSGSYVTDIYEDTNFHVRRVAGSGLLYLSEGWTATALPSLTSYANNTDFNGDVNIYNGKTITTYTGSATGANGKWNASTGNLSLGKTSANARLDVSGSAIISGSLIVNTEIPTLYTTKLLTSSAGSNTIYSAATSSYNGAFFDYVVSSGSNARAGQMMSVWNGSNVVYTETTTTDIGSTSGVSLTVILSGANVLLTGSFADADWVMKTSVKLI